jgi:hypothetical protein
MPLRRFAKNPTRISHRARPVTPSCRGGASSLLRLSQPAHRLPHPLDLSDWASRAASVVLPVTGPLTDWHGQNMSRG